MTYIIMTLSIKKGLFLKLSIYDIQQKRHSAQYNCHDSEYLYAKCHDLFIVMLKAELLNVIMLSVIMLNVVASFTVVKYHFK
jgi:hypothetical protein